jgi:hypothetical protein
MNKFGNCSQWRSELLIPRILLFSVGNGAMNALRYWQQRNERSRLLETGTKMPSGPLRPIQLRKAVNREDKRSRRYRDRHFAKFERSRRYRDR